MLALAPIMVAVVLVSVTGASGNSERAEKPKLRTTLPSRVDAPKDVPPKTRVVPATAEKTGDAKVNVNTADVKGLMTLTGVGRKVAERIVEYRDSHGPFRKADEIRKVEGVGHGVWERNRDRIVVK